MDTGKASLIEQGIQALQSGHLAQAIDLLNQALKQNPNDVLTATYLGIAHCRQKDFETEIPMLTQATQLQPANATFQYNLAVGLYQAGRKGRLRARSRYRPPSCPSTGGPYEAADGVGERESLTTNIGAPTTVAHR